MTADSLTRPRVAARIVLAGAIATLAGAWAFQLIGGLPPCPLCLQQRWSWYAAIPLLAIALAAGGRGQDGRVTRGLLALTGVIVLAGGALAVYHAGIEWGWWPGPAACSGGAGLGTATGLPDLSNPQVVACDEAAWRLFGLSLAGYNALISFGLGALALISAARTR